MGGVGDAALEVRLFAEPDGGAEIGLAEEDEAMVLGKLIQKEAQLADDIDRQEVGIVDDGDDCLAHGVEPAGFGAEACLAFQFTAGGFELETLAVDGRIGIVAFYQIVIVEYF